MAKRAAARARKPRGRGSRPAAVKPLEHNILLTATLCLLAAGAVMVYSASSARTLLQGQGDGTTYLVRYVIYGALGLVAMHQLSRRGLDVVARVTGPLLAIAFAGLVLVKLPGIGVEVNGARRWIGAGPLQFQPSELAKLALVLYAVKFLVDKPKSIREPRLLVPLLGIFAVACLLVATQPDLGTALVVAFTLVCLLIAAGIPMRYLLIGLGVGAMFVVVFAIMEPYRRARLTAFIN